MGENRFTHKVSRGSRFNQIYIPKEMELVFEVGDIVKVELVRKNQQIFCSKNVKLSEFKEKLIREIFSFLSQFREIKQVFVFGSFLTKKTDYNDIDLIIISEKKNLEEEVYEKLTDKLNMKFHVISLPEEKFGELSEICPLTRGMLYYSVSNRKFKVPGKKLDKKHISFLLMMPKDLLKINAGSRVFYDNIRRLITIEGFLRDKEINPEEAEKEIKVLLGNIFELARNNENFNPKQREELRRIIKNKLKDIAKLE